MSKRIAWWKFWRPETGFVGGSIMALALTLIVMIAIAILARTPRYEAQPPGTLDVITK